MSKNLNKLRKLLLEFYSTVPFHNLWLLEGERNNKDESLGGTCTDKTLYFHKIVSNEGFLFRLHNAFINNEPCHRILLGECDGRTCLLDVGDGGPLVEPFFFNENKEHSFFGFNYTQKSDENIFQLFLLKPTGPTMSFFTRNEVIPEEIIRLKIIEDFRNTSINPFHFSLRFSKLVGNKFYRIENNILKIGSEKGIEKREIKSLNELENLFKNIFYFDFGHVLKGIEILKNRNVFLFTE